MALLLLLLLIVMIIDLCLFSAANKQTNDWLVLKLSYCFIKNNPKLTALQQQLITSHDTVD